MLLVVGCQLLVAYCSCILQMELESVRQSVSQPAVYHLPGTHAFHFSRRQLPCLPGQRSPTIYSPIPPIPIPIPIPIPSCFFPPSKTPLFHLQFLFLFRFVFIHNSALGWIWIGKCTGCLQINAKLCLGCTATPKPSYAIPARSFDFCICCCCCCCCVRRQWGSCLLWVTVANGQRLIMIVAGKVSSRFAMAFFFSGLQGDCPLR